MDSRAVLHYKANLYFFLLCKQNAGDESWDSGFYWISGPPQVIKEIYYQSCRLILTDPDPESKLGLSFSTQSKDSLRLYSDNCPCEL